MTDTALDDLVSSLERSGYYPRLVADAVRAGLAGDAMTAHVVQQETTLDDEANLHRHITVLALTPTRLLVCHTDEHPPQPGDPHAHATTTVESIPLRRVTTVALTTVMGDPAAYRPGADPEEATLTVGWGALSRVDLAPASCDDETCDADHGFTGDLSADDLALRASGAADGLEVVRALLAFGSLLSRAAGDVH